MCVVCSVKFPGDSRRGGEEEAFNSATVTGPERSWWRVERDGGHAAWHRSVEGMRAGQGGRKGDEGGDGDGDGDGRMLGWGGIGLGRMER